MTESGGGARDNEQYGVDTGGSTTGDTYSYGAATSTERALGALRSGTLIPIVGACFTNNTGSTISSLDVAYTGEEWRLGTVSRTDQINFEYSLNATDLVTGTWTGVAALNFVTPDTATAGAKNGNAAADRTVIAPVSIPALSIANGATFWIRWNDTDATAVTITIQALIEADVAPGTTITNQATIQYDADGNGTNEATAVTDDPSQSGGGQPTGFVVGAAAADTAEIRPSTASASPPWPPSSRDSASSSPAAPDFYAVTEKATTPNDVVAFFHGAVFTRRESAPHPPSAPFSPSR